MRVALSMVSSVVLAGMSLTALAETCEVIPTMRFGKIATPYEGECRNGRANGRGKYTMSYGPSQRYQRMYAGAFVDGKLHGEATIRELDTKSGVSSDVVAEFADNKLDGKHRRTGADGKVEEVTYKDNKIVAGGRQVVTATAEQALNRPSSASYWRNYDPSKSCQDNAIAAKGLTPARDYTITYDALYKECLALVKKAYIHKPTVTSGKGIGSLGEIKTKCGGLIRLDNGNRVIIEHLESVTYLQPIKRYDTEATPTTVIFFDQDARKLKVNVYLFKDPFGDIKCRHAE